RYAPSAPVTAVCGWMSAGLLAVTVTPGSTAALLSVTVPVNRPRNSWANAGAASTRRKAIVHRNRGAGLLILTSSNTYNRCRTVRGYASGSAIFQVFYATAG